MNIQVKVLGTGCAKCKTLEKLTREVVSEYAIDAEIEKVEDIVEIMKYGVMSTPALVVQGKTVVSGRIPSKDEIFNLISKTSHES